jgi:hypothetical protein
MISITVFWTRVVDPIEIAELLRQAVTFAAAIRSGPLAQRLALR